MSEEFEPSWWQRTPGDEPAPLEPLVGRVDADVAIVGAGFTGLWTACYLKRLDPSLSVCLLEARYAGAGASGRNGGWCVGEMAGQPAAHEKKQPGSALRMARAAQESVDEVGRFCREHGIDCHYAKGGSIFPAVNAAQWKRLGARVAAARELGLGEEDCRLLSARETEQHIRLPGLRGGMYTPHCAALHPYRLVRGLVRAARGMGVALYEESPVSALEGGRVRTPRGEVAARVVVRATEAYTDSIDGQKRQIIPLYEHMVVTEPLPESTWQAIGLADRQTFEDARHMIYYGQRTADGRIAIGGLSASYRFGSRIDGRQSGLAVAYRRLERLLGELFPHVPAMAIEHRWGGVLGVPRDLYPSVGYDPATGFAWAGGYVGEGVAAANLAGRTLADLILEKRTTLTELPWVNHRSPRWEPEPLRWLGTTAMTTLLRVLDRVDEGRERLSRR